MTQQFRKAEATSHETRAPTDPPFVIDVFGEVAPNGEAIGLRVERTRQGPVDLCLRSEDVQFMVSMLLTLSCEAKRRQAPVGTEAPPREAIPLPLTAINVGQDDRDQPAARALRAGLLDRLASEERQGSLELAGK